MYFTWSFVFVIVLEFFLPHYKCDTIDSNYGYSDVQSAENPNPYSMLCMDIRPQHSLDIEQIMGMWYGNEIIKHTQDVPGVFTYDSCVIIYLADATEQMSASARDYNYNSYRRTSSMATYEQQHQQQQQQQSQLATKYLRLVWTEKDDNLEYTFNYTDSMPGFWTNVGDQRGSLVALNQYSQFSGTVQVLKAVNDHLVLTFCGNDVKSSIYTIVLSRNEEAMSSEELRSIRSLLTRRGLYTGTIRKVCTSAAVNLRAPTMFLTILGILFAARKMY